MPIVPREIEIGKSVCIGGFGSLFLIGGPCVIESEEHAFGMAESIKLICDDLNLPVIFKASFDKANRSSLSSYRGPGLKEGLRILARIRRELDLPILSDVHEPSQVEPAAEILDVLQIPALLCRQTDLLVEAARTGKPVNLKKGQFLSPREMTNAVEKMVEQGNENLILTERGTCFGYNNLVFDVRSIPILKEMGFPVAVDASHSNQQPGGEGKSSGGEAGFIPHIARAGISVGADGVFMEIHDRPAEALSDKHNSLNTNDLKPLLQSLKRLRKALVRTKC